MSGNEWSNFISLENFQLAWRRVRNSTEFITECVKDMQQLLEKD
jgi:hypothetical protein